MVWLAAPLALGGCDILPNEDAVDLCLMSPPHAECEQCRTLPRAAECPQCLGNSPDPDCENSTDAGGGGAPLPLIDGSLPGTGGDSAAADSGTDAGPADAGPDASPPACGESPGAAGEGGCPDAGACPQGCGGAKPRCDKATDTCVECRKDGDCGSSKPLCNASHECVECLAHADCADPAAARCSSAQKCVSCTASAQCAHLSGTTVCDASDGDCVECTVADESSCAGKSCDPATLTCTTTSLASVGVCEACIADSECEADHRCIPMFYMGAAHGGGYCMKIGSTGCARPYLVTPVVRASLSGVAAQAYCVIDESRTTCEAVRALDASAGCTTPTVATDCAAQGARCETVNLGTNKCTYDCGSSLGCVDGADCSSGYCGGP
jgi:hypothetical protein